MPLYEYRCRSCGERTEVLQRLGDAPLAECPKCGGPVEKVISAPGLQFKGSGWYVTDYARGSHASGTASSETSTESKGSTSEKPSSDSAKSDPK